MPRPKRHRVSQLAGSYHIISRTVGGTIYFNDEEKEYFLKLMKRFASGFFIEIHAFCIMGNHFHILATDLEQEAKKASVEELHRRYRLIYPDQPGPPQGAYGAAGRIIPDEDGGDERLRNRLGSISRFVQELKQTFSRWYNKKYKRKGYLWSDRFKGVIVSKGEAQLICSSYIDLNPVRAGIVKCPEDYRWSSLGMRVRDPVRAKGLLTLLFSESTKRKKIRETDYVLLLSGNPREQLDWYREFVYLSGGVKKEEKVSISPALLREVTKCHGKMGLEKKLAHRIKNMSEGVAIGSHSFIASFLAECGIRNISTQTFLDNNVL